MLKELLNKYPELDKVVQYRYRCLSILSLEKKKKICRSWIRGSDTYWISRFHNVTEKEVKACIEELIQMASALGKKRLIRKGVKASDGYAYLIGEMSQFWPSADMKKELGYKTMKEITIIRERFEELTGVPPKGKPDRNRKYFRYIRKNVSSYSPSCNKRMKVLKCGLQMSKELKFDGMNFEKVGTSYYCMEGLREFFVYEGDENGNPSGLYEIAYEYIE